MFPLGFFIKRGGLILGGWIGFGDVHCDGW